MVYFFCLVLRTIYEIFGHLAELAEAAQDLPQVTTKETIHQIFKLHIKLKLIMIIRGYYVFFADILRIRMHQMGSRYILTLFLIGGGSNVSTFSKN